MSTGDWAYLPLSLYYTTNGATVQRFRVRYAGRGVSDYSPYVNHTVQYCRLENCGFGVFAYSTTVNMLNNEVCNVATNKLTYGSGSISYSWRFFSSHLFL